MGDIVATGTRLLTKEDLEFPIVGVKEGFLDPCRTFEDLAAARWAGLRAFEGMTLYDSGGRACVVTEAVRSDKSILRLLVDVIRSKLFHVDIYIRSNVKIIELENFRREVLEEIRKEDYWSSTGGLPDVIGLVSSAEDHRAVMEALLSVLVLDGKAEGFAGPG